MGEKSDFFILHARRTTRYISAELFDDAKFERKKKNNNYYIVTHTMEMVSCEEYRFPSL